MKVRPILLEVYSGPGFGDSQLTEATGIQESPIHHASCTLSRSTKFVKCLQYDKTSPITSCSVAGGSISLHVSLCFSPCFLLWKLSEFPWEVKDDLGTSEDEERERKSVSPCGIKIIKCNFKICTLKPLQAKNGKQNYITDSWDFSPCSGCRDYSFFSQILKEQFSFLLEHQALSHLNWEQGNSKQNVEFSEVQGRKVQAGKEVRGWGRIKGLLFYFGFCCHSGRQGCQRTRSHI